MIDEHAEDGEGLAHDLKTLRRMADRRSILRWMIGTSLVPLVGCAGDATAAGAGSDGGVTACSKIPEEHPLRDLPEPCNLFGKQDRNLPARPAEDRL